ncbi:MULTISPECIES: Rap1a/Tai family immunity protein [unclassified Pseudomonas]|uniref:Rap1a/Tai family immunity protein n=1 Tax=unclassified Pseudomonas TaxID=196821 RepID=UPI0008713C06|nr:MULTISPECIES: Rap1a/Tai family immunity protein [unclassified Pseudomonas]SCW88564.1 hypothetical protein SAMN03159424_03934 [Pseudomonas sp. NFACC05-1]SFL47609.1 hypothetical protein SAMN03159307_02762 [Pseudomonas sp. NFACC46-3]
MKVELAAVIVLVGMLASGTVNAEDGGEGLKFLNGCKGLLSFWDGKLLTADADVAAMGYCVGVVNGVRGTLQNLNGWMKNDHAKLCLPADYVESMGVKTVVRFLENHPDKLKSNAVSITMLALQAEYPCH